ncbi:hypothetical protein NDU88_005640 [Pleurodeles waltl]|uniref:Uncharacterized protein n=1 Tax=Pleurodeles waltl TaxID=8319 RepID=A0AAV7UIS7_PLEWA|nr:hypothetical protein NDU88_005640 [Pleurodeles waltl]
MLNLAVPLAPATPTTLLVFPVFGEGEESRAVRLLGLRPRGPSVLTLPGFPRRGILAEPLRARRSSSAARPQCRSLPPGASLGAWNSRVSGVHAVERHIQPITAYACHAPRNGGRLHDNGFNASDNGF